MAFNTGSSDFTGDIERQNIVDRLSGLTGGRVWEVQVPDHIDLERVTDGGVKPYLILRFADPIALASGRSIAANEQQQPQQMTFTVIGIGSDMDSVNALISAAKKKLVGWEPSGAATQITSRGGFEYPRSDTSSTPTRYQRASFMRFRFTPNA